MDRSHKLDAPDNESLSSIDQVGDHSNLSTLYRRAKNDWTGELITDEERERRRQKKDETMSFGIRKHFVTVSLFITAPIVVMSSLITVALTFVTETNAAMLVIPAIFLFLFWVMATIASYKKAYALFYNNALQATPFIITLLMYLGLCAAILHTITLGVHNNNTLQAGLIISAIELLISIVITGPLLLLWTTPKLSGNVKMLIIALPIAGLIGANLYIAFS